jgi:hypothetical protein
MCVVCSALGALPNHLLSVFVCNSVRAIQRYRRKLPWKYFVFRPCTVSLDSGNRALHFRLTLHTKYTRPVTASCYFPLVAIRQLCSIKAKNKIWQNSKQTNQQEITPLPARTTHNCAKEQRNISNIVCWSYISDFTPALPMARSKPYS